MLVLTRPYDSQIYAMRDYEAAQVIAFFTVHWSSHAPGTGPQATPTSYVAHKSPKRA